MYLDTPGLNYPVMAPRVRSWGQRGVYFVVITGKRRGDGYASPLRF